MLTYMGKPLKKSSSLAGMSKRDAGGGIALQGGFVNGLLRAGLKP